jgi:hypothetical protein
VALQIERLQSRLSQGHSESGGSPIAEPVVRHLKRLQCTLALIASEPERLGECHATFFADGIA